MDSANSICQLNTIKETVFSHDSSFLIIPYLQADIIMVTFVPHIPFPKKLAIQNWDAWVGCGS